MVATPAPQRAAGRRALAHRGRALPDGSFPVPNGEYWDKARQAIGRVKDPAKRTQVAKLLRKTAPQVGRSAALKESWAAPGGSQHANDLHGIGLAVRTKDEQGLTLTCPECSYSGPANRFGANGASLDKSPGILRTPAPGTGFTRTGAATTVRGGKAAHALANSNAAVELAAATAKRVPVSGPYDVGVRRSDKGSVLYHRRSGTEIATMRRNDDDTWTAVVAGKELQPHAQQRAALMEAVDTYNAAVHAGVKRAEAPLQPPPQQTELMREYGIPAMRSAAFATPMTSSSSGARMTTAGGKGGKDPDHDGDNDYSVKGDTDKDYAGALGPKGRSAYAKLLKRGIPAKRALALAKHADSMSTRAA